MAEAVVEERTSVPTRFYCHMCNVEINIPNTDFTCPLCAGGFVEELPATHPPANNTNGGGSTSSSIVPDPPIEPANFNRLADIEQLRTLILPQPNSGNRRGAFLTLSGNAGGSNTNVGNSGSGGGGGGSSNMGGGRVRGPNMDRLDNVLLDFLQSLSGGDMEAPFGTSQMFYMGNLGDYAWGREGIDTIVTQLLNQMETSGPPPLAKEKIAEIPKVEICAEEVDRKIQCSVCWEDFRLQEVVRKLPCSHIYHENCIVPWLDLHGTCPICRKSLTDDDVDDIAMDTHESGVGFGAGVSGSSSGQTTSSRNYACPMHRNTTATDISGSNGGGNTRATTSHNATATTTNETNAGGSNATNSTSQTQNQRNNIFSFEDGNVDLD